MTRRRQLNKLILLTNKINNNANVIRSAMTSIVFVFVIVFLYLPDTACANFCITQDAEVVQQGDDVNPVVEDTPETEAEAEDEIEVAFNFKGVSYAEVIDFFSRASGLPVIQEVDPPAGILTYFAPEPYSLSEGLRILNIILQTKMVTLRREGQFLYLGKLDKATHGPAYVRGEIPGEVSDDQLITVLIPLENVTAQELSERLTALVGAYGGLISLPQQNSLLLTETAGQVRRLQTIIDALDSAGDYKDQIQIFPLQYAQADTLMETLKILMSERVVKYVINQQGQQVKLEEDDLAGLRIQADKRTNTIIAKGPDARLQDLEEMIAMLDVSGRGYGTGQEMATVNLGRITANEATKLLDTLFKAIPAEQKPTVVPLEDVNKITVIGSTLAITQAVALLCEVDGGGDDPANFSQSTLFVSLNEAAPQVVQMALSTLMTPRQSRLVKMLVAPDGKGLIFTGPSGDVNSVRDMALTLDMAPSNRPKEVRIIRLAKEGGSAQGIIDRVNELYGLQVDISDSEFAIDIQKDPESNILTLIGERTAIDKWQQVLQTVESTLEIERETRQLHVNNARPSELVRPMTTMAGQLLKPVDGSLFTAPVIAAIDELDILLVTAAPEQWSVIDMLLSTLDEQQVKPLQFKVVRVTSRNVKELAEEANQRYAEQTAGYDEELYGPVGVEIDEKTGSLLLTAMPQALSTYTNILNQLQQLVPPARTTQFVQFKQAHVSEVLPRLQKLLEQADPIDIARKVPDPTFVVMEESNGVLVKAEAAQHRIIADLVSYLDVMEPTDMPPLRLLQLRSADVVQIAGLLNAQYGKRPTEQRRSKPVEIQADPSTNTLIVSAHEDLFEDIRDFVDRLNKEQKTTTAERVTEIFPLKIAKASELANAMNMLYPEPPVPVDRRGNPMPWLRESREVQISYDQVSNSIIVDAPAERIPAFQALVEKLDRMELPAEAELRTYAIRGADIQTITKTLSQLASSGTLSSQNQAGKPRVPVSITAEPVSGTLIVTGDSVTFEKVEQLLKNLQAVPVERELRVVQIANADPQKIADQASAIYTEQTKDIEDAGAVDVQIDEMSNSLMIIADAQAIARYTSIVSQLQRTIGPGQEVRHIPLEHANAAEVVDFLRDLAESSRSFRSSTPGAQPVFESIERTNSILVAAQPVQHQLIEGLIRSLDVIEDQELPPVRILQVETADASNLAGVLDQVYNARPTEERKLKPVSIRADPATNSLLVSAHPDPFAEIQTIVTELNEARKKATTGREIRIFPLKVARAEELAKTIDQMFPDPPVPLDRRGNPMYNLREPREVVVRADAQTNSIIVDAPVERMLGFEELVKQLDTAEIPADAEVRTYAIEFAELRAVQNAIQQLVQSGVLVTGNTRGGRSVPITVNSEPVTNTLIVAGPVEIFDKVEKVLTELDAEPDRPVTVLKFFKLKNARAERLVPLLQEVLLPRLEEEIKGMHGVDVRSLLEVTSETKTNTLIISAPESIMSVVEQLVEQLDDQTALLSDPVIRIVPLTFADSVLVAQTLNSTLPQVISKTTREPIDVRIIASPGSNALVLVGIVEELDEVEKLIEPLDARPGLDTLVAETFALQYADAVHIATMVERLLVDQQEMDPRIQAVLLRNRNISLQNKPRIRVEADERTNSLIVSAPQQTLALAKTLIEQLDIAAPENERQVVTFTPRKAVPGKLVATTVRMLNAGGGRDKVELIADDVSGVVVAIGRGDRLKEAMALLEDFDSRVPEMPEVDLQVVTVHNIDAQVAADTLNQILRDRARWPQNLREAQRAGLPIADPTVSADPETGRILISAPKQLTMFARQVITQFDTAKDKESSREMRVFHLKRANAEQVAATLQQMWEIQNSGSSIAANNQQANINNRRGGRNPRNAMADVSGSAAGATGRGVSIVAEPSTNAVIVAATPAQMIQIEQLIEPLDLGIAMDQIQVRTIYLENSRAELVAPVVERLLNTEALDPRIVFEFMRRGVPSPDTGPEVRVAVEPRLNAVILSASGAMLDVAEEMVRQLDVDPDMDPAKQRFVRVIALHNADAKEVAGNLEAVLADEMTAGEVNQPVIRVDQSSNSLIVRATDKQFELIDVLINDLETATIAGARQMRMIPIDRSRADAKQTAETLRRLLEQSGGPVVEVITIEDLLKRQEVDKDNKNNKNEEEIGLLPTDISNQDDLKNNNRLPYWLAVTGMMMLSSTNTATAGEADYFYDDDNQVKAVVAVIDENEKDTDTEVKQKTHGFAGSILTAVKKAVGDDIFSGEDEIAEVALEIEPDDGDDTVAGLAGVAEIFNEENLFASLFRDKNEKDDTSENVTVNPAATATSTELANQEDDEYIYPEVTIAVDEATNSLIVVGSPFATQRLQELAEQIQSQMPAMPENIRYIALDESADVNQLSNLITRTINQLRNRPGGLTGLVSVVPDIAGPGLIVSANNIDFVVVGSLIAALSQPVQGDSVTVRIYPLTTIAADRARQSIEDLLSLDDGGGAGRRGGGRGRQAQRMHQVMIHVGDDNGAEIESLLDSTRVMVSVSPNNDALIVAAPDETLAVIDRYIELIDQAPAGDIAGIRQFNIRYADAGEVMGSLQRVFQAQARAQQGVAGIGQQVVRADFSADKRTNTILVTGTTDQFKEVEQLLTALDVPLMQETNPLTIIELVSTVPSRLKSILDQVIIGGDLDKRERIVMVPDDGSQLLLVRANPDDLAAIESIVREIDRFETKEFPVRTIKLALADADRVSQALQKFFDDRAKISQRPGQQQKTQRRISVIGDKRSGTLLIAASDDDYAEIEGLVKVFDSPSEAQDLKFQIIALKHAKAVDVFRVVSDMSYSLTYDSNIGRWGGTSSERGQLSIQEDERSNSIVLSGTGENFALIEQVVHALDVPVEHSMKRAVRIVSIKNGDTEIIARAARDAFVSQNNPWWWYNEPDPDEIKILTDPRNKLLVVSGAEEDLESVVAFVTTLDEAAMRPDQIIEVIDLNYARAREVETTLTRFYRDRARAASLPTPGLTITSADDSNKLVVSATAEELATIHDMLAHIDLPAEGDDRVVELYVLKYGRSNEILNTIEELFPTRGISPDQMVRVTADARTNSLIISAPQEKLPEIAGVIELVDAPATGEVKLIQTIALSNARAEDVADILNQTLDLSAAGGTGNRTRGNAGRRGMVPDVTRFIIGNENKDDNTAATGLDGVEIEARITPSIRNNSLIVVTTPESMPLVMKLVSDLDKAPVVSVREYKIYPLQHAVASEVRSTLSSLMSTRGVSSGTREPAPSISYSTRDNNLIVAATTDQHVEITEILKQIDMPSQRTRSTEFVPLEFAQAEKVADALDVFYGRFAFEADTPGKKNVSIVPDPASNSLVISAEEEEWPGIKELIAKLDAEEYDSSLQLKVIALEYAESRSVATAINQAFAPEVQGGGQRGGRNGGGDRQGQGNNGDGSDQQANQPRILVEDSDVVRAAAEPLTNSIIVTASRRNMQKIEGIIEQLDVADFARMPAVRLIPMEDADADKVAVSLRTMYEDITNSEAGRRGSGGRKTVLITSDKTSNTIIVRAEDEQFEQIEALAKALEETSDREGITVRVLPLTQALATRVSGAIAQTFQATAKEMDEPLSIQVDATANSLVIASSARLYEQISEVVKQLDALGPGGGRQIYVVPLENIAPAEMKRILETLELDKPQRDGSSSLLTEPIKITVLEGRNAIAVLANPADRERLLEIVGPLDSAPQFAEAEMRIIPLHMAEAGATAAILRDIMNPSEQHADTPLAQAMREQIRRLSMQRGDWGETESLILDLSKPVRILDAPGINALIVSSTSENCDALAEIIELFDRLPVTDAVLVRMFPLENMSAAMMRSIAGDLYKQSAELRRQPGTDIDGEPASEIGHALLGEVAMTIDERTNMLIVAGREEALAFIEVLVNQLDSEQVAKWVEPRLIQLIYADADSLAETLNEVLVKGIAVSRTDNALQTQVGRLRIAVTNQEEDWPEIQTMADADIFVPMSRLLITPDAQLNSLIVVGTPDNIEVVNALVSMLDVPAAAPSNAVRIYTLDHASAARVSSVVTRLFDQQVQSKAIRPEDKVIAQADERTNSLIVTTSPRSFTVLETLLESLDGERLPDLREIRMVKLENASATLIASQIQELMDARLERLRRVEPEAAELEQATIIADARTNNLLVAAGNESFEVIEQLARALDNSSSSALYDVQVIALSKGNAASVAQTLETVIDRQYADLPKEMAAREKPLILTDSRSNSLLVSANEEDFKRLRDLVKTLEETPLNPAVGLHVVQVAQNSAENLAPRLQRLMVEREKSLGADATGQDHTYIQADPISNSLIVAASDTNLEILQGLIKTLGNAEELASADEIVEIFTLKNSQADRMIELLNQLYVNQVTKVRGQDTIRITADERLNAVLVSASREDVVAIKRLIAELETAQVTDVRVVEIVPLRAANSAELVSLLENVLTGGRRRSNDLQSSIMRFIRSKTAEEIANQTGLEPTEAQVTLAVREAIRLTPDLRTNSIIVSAPASSMLVIKEMIEDLDSAESGSKRVQIFELVNADAMQMAEILRDLFNLRQEGRMYVLRPRDDGGSASTRMAGNNMGIPSGGEPGGTPVISGGNDIAATFTDTELITVPDARQQLSITVDPRTNSLLVSGTPRYLELVEEVVTSLDSKTGANREEMVFELRNARAAEVAVALTDFLTQEQERLLRTLGPERAGSILQQLEREVSVVGVEESNTLLISASPRYVEQIQHIISELDKAPPQVLISVMLAEVTLDSDQQWGMDITGGPVEMGESYYSGSSTFGLAGAAISGLGVPNLSVSTDDFDFLIRALEAQGKLEVLSRPQILVNNNQQARFQVGQEISLVSFVQFTDQGVSNAPVTRVDIGVILDVLPSISPDRFVRMDVNPSITSLSARTTQISENFDAPIIDKREVKTVVTVKDGQTVVIGGLFSNRSEMRKQKVPFFGDIPVLGALFRTSLHRREKTELLVVITPHVVSSMEEAQEYTEGEIIDMTLPESTKAQLRQGRIDSSSMQFDTDIWDNTEVQEQQETPSELKDENDNAIIKDEEVNEVKDDE